MLQIAVGWSDAHLHRFIIHGKDDGSARLGGLTFADYHCATGHRGLAPADRRLHRGPAV